MLFQKLKKDVVKNILYVTQGNGEELYSKGLISFNVNWLVEPRTNEFKCKAKFRYRQEEQDVAVFIENEKTKVVFDKPQKAITLGQYVVFYDNNICLGGGVIEEILKGK